ncbi:hypothetical protein C1645_730749 [Glomus cerebriforme]|uniref:Uncharacterized protein n=1 Tax=Glomus cerebriforme TaxID=658196 RepID=A0A397TN92_9GLOM|nr:hypothetical protein C1645_730749 [Glomus cerebriforme]
MSSPSFLLVRILHLLVVFLLIGVFGYQLFNDIKNFGVITQAFNVTSEKELVPPALTFCITKDTGYTFSIEVYNQTVEKNLFLEAFPADSYELAPLSGQVVRCWVLSPPIGSDRALIKNPPPVANVPDLVFTTTRTLGNGLEPLLVNIFDPLQRDSLFDFNRFLLLDPDVNRAIQFTRTKHIDINKNEFNDIKYNIIDEFRDPAQTVPGVSSTNKFTFRAASFDVEVSRDVRTTTIWSIIFSSLTFLGVLIGNIYIPLIGRGKYRPWGYINRLIGYYPIEHIQRSLKSPHLIEDGLLKNNDNNIIKLGDSPRIEEKLEIYLDRIEKANYSN